MMTNPVKFRRAEVVLKVAPLNDDKSYKIPTSEVALETAPVSDDKIWKIPTC